MGYDVTMKTRMILCVICAFPAAILLVPYVTLGIMLTVPLWSNSRFRKKWGVPKLLHQIAIQPLIQVNNLLGNQLKSDVPRNPTVSTLQYHHPNQPYLLKYSSMEMFSVYYDMYHDRRNKIWSANSSGLLTVFNVVHTEYINDDINDEMTLVHFEPHFTSFFSGVLARIVIKRTKESTEVKLYYNLLSTENQRKDKAFGDAIVSFYKGQLQSVSYTSESWDSVLPNFHD